MEPKRYIGNDLARIYQRVRRELGPDAIIVETRSLLREGAEPLIELLALAPQADGLPLDLQHQLVTGVLARVEHQPLARTIGDLEDLAAREDQLPEALPPRPVPFAEAHGELPEWLEGFVDDAPPAPRTSTRGAGDQSQELPPLKFASRPVPRPPSPPAHPSGNIDSPSPLTPHVTAGPAGDRFAPNPPAASGHLTAAGFSLAAALAVEPFASPGRSMQDALAEALRTLPVAYPDERQTSLISIQGPGGSGRTTALIRMALDCAESGRTAILVAADTSRIAAREQIHAYGEALGLEVLDAYSHQELVLSVSTAPKGACLFIDLPAGPWQAPALPSIKHFAYLALPTQWQAQSLALSLTQFPQSDHAGFVLTFTDLGGCLAPALSLLFERWTGVAFLSSGRDVSTGIAVADPLTLASGIFNAPLGVEADGPLVASA